MTTYAYLRVSTIDQDVKKFHHEILEFANTNDLGKVHFIEEKVSGQKNWQDRKIGKIIEEAKKGDNIIVPEFSRLGRRFLELMEIFSIAIKKQINIYAVKGNWKLDDSIQSKAFALVIGLAAEIEREFISLRTKEALAAKKAQGVKLGRRKGAGKSKLDKYKDEIIALLKTGSTQKYIAAKYKTTPANLHNWLKKNKINKNPEI